MFAKAMTARADDRAPSHDALQLAIVALVLDHPSALLDDLLETLGEPAETALAAVADLVASGVLERDGRTLSPSPASSRLAALFDLP